MQHVSTYNSHLQAELTTVIVLQGGYEHLGSNMAYSILLLFFFYTVWLIQVFNVLLKVVLFVRRVHNYLCLLFFCFRSSPLDWGSVGGGFLSSTCTSVCLCFLFMGGLRLVLSFVMWLPVSLVQCWVGLSFCLSVAYPSCGVNGFPRSNI